MKLNGYPGRVVLALATLIAIHILGGVAHARNKAYQVLYEFGQGSSDGWEPLGTLAVANNGDLYGVTEGGGTYNIFGTVFKLTAPRTRGACGLSRRRGTPSLSLRGRGLG